MKSLGWGTRTQYAGVDFRSKGEAASAKYLDSLRIAWKYEPITFRNGATRYTPDFGIDDLRVLVEVKPWRGIGCIGGFNKNTNLAWMANGHTVPDPRPLIHVSGLPTRCSVLLFTGAGWLRVMASFDEARKKALEECR